MPYEQPYEQETAPRREHAVAMENRARMTLTGVEDVSGFDENTVVLTTSMGELTVRGEALHIERIDLELGCLELDGHIRELSYDEAAERLPLLARLFG